VKGASTRYTALEYMEYHDKEPSAEYGLLKAGSAVISILARVRPVGGRYHLVRDDDDFDGARRQALAPSRALARGEAMGVAAVGKQLQGQENPCAA